MIKMERQGRKGKGHALCEEVRLGPDHLKLQIVDDPNLFDPIEIATQRCRVHIRILHHINVKLEVMGSDRHIFPLFPGDRVCEIVPQHPRTQPDTECTVVRRFLPGLRQKRLIDPRFFIVVLRQRTVG